MRRERKVRKTNFFKDNNSIKVGKTRQKFKLTSITSRQIRTLSTKFSSSQYLKGRLREVENRLDGHRVDGRTYRRTD